MIMVLVEAGSDATPGARLRSLHPASARASLAVSSPKAHAAGSIMNTEMRAKVLPIHDAGGFGNYRRKTSGLVGSGVKT